MNTKIDALTVISAATCNLNCSFCYLHSNPAYKEYHKLVHNAWDSGEYLSNIKKTLNILECDYNDIETIQVWGGETLLGIKDLTKNLDELYMTFPNISKWMFSTNFTGMVDEFMEFLIKVNQLTKIPTNILFQISIDGPPGPFTEQGHNGKWDTYKTNLVKFTKLMNNTKLKNIVVDLNIHATVGKDLYIKEFTSYEAMKEYMQYMFNFSKEIQNSCISESLRYMQTFIYPNLATPYNDTTEDGIKLAQVFKLWDQVYEAEFSSEIHYNDGFYLGIGNFFKDTNYLAGNPQCREGKSGLTINYDGSICECNGSFINMYEPYLQAFNNEENKNSYYEAIVHNKMTGYYPDKLSKEELQRKIWAVHEGGYRGVKTMYIHFLMSLGKELAKQGQILQQYAHNDDLLFKHCWLFLNRISCSRNNIADTKLPYLTPVGAMRRFFNGAMDFLYEKGVYDKTIKYL